MQIKDIFAKIVSGT